MPVVRSVVVLDEQQVDHEADDVARGEVLAGGLVGDFGELADQLLEDQAHVVVADLVGVQGNDENRSVTW